MTLQQGKLLNSIHHPAFGGSGANQKASTDGIEAF